MAKNDNPHALRFLASAEKHGKAAEAERFAAEYPLSKSAEADRKFEWAKHLCEFTDANFDTETAKAIRMDCACGPELGKGKKLKELYEKSGDFTLFAEKANKLNQGFTIEYDGSFLYLIYPQCYCSCVKRVPETLPESWCYCTLGYTKTMFGYILGREVGTELVTSVKTGGDCCRIKIIP